ncbi:ATP-binding cassette domain-containing protein [Amycolatopsis jiangsuensis]|uniref:ABC-2 type transport system ATP-binding protein n=1 Tax=Amycolatopsis jiangsuensis TaxID=1181879 RepID=A0A840ISE3_9PSEU|nr:ABC transporter ATP-binding protein [Amycolatopsis jiangsuensis]MBB4684122.1 ABC-2 type transport system ATP-binding protein [Amycolatopsis jiangsuensis]
MTQRESRPALRADRLGKRYRRGWALRDCTLAVPSGRVVGLVGPNGAGKSTFLGLLTGLLQPTEGQVEVAGARPSGRQPDHRVSFLSQEKPLYPQFTVEDQLRFGRSANPQWDQAHAEHYLTRGRVPAGARIGTLSGGQRTWVALAVALGTHPELVLLDEPLADLDPVARGSVLAALAEERQRHGTTIVLSSHVLAELEEVCDHLLLFAGGQVRLAGDVRDLIAGHTVLSGPLGGPIPVPARTVVDATRGDRGTHLLVTAGAGAGADPVWHGRPPTLTQLALGYLRAAHEEVAA